MSKLKGLYAITSTASPDILHAVEQALAGGARIVQFRDKSADKAARQQLAKALKYRCDKYQVPLLINDDVQLAASVGAAGVHLGQQDCSLALARETLGAKAIIGISCYNQLELARAAERDGADYVAFGRFFPSRTKPGAKPASLDVLHAARAQINIPVVAIGGITPENAQPIVSAGADMIAVIDGLFGQPDVRTAAITFSRLFG